MTTAENKSGSRTRNFMIRLVNAKYSVPSWLWAIASTSLGALIIFYSFTNPALVAAFLAPLPFHGWVWAPLLTLGGLAAMLGMAKDNSKLLRLGAFVSFLMWIFGTITFYISGGIGNVIIFAGPMLVYWGYKYLASYVREFSRM